jgi:hypothetical protein
MKRQFEIAESEDGAPPTEEMLADLETLRRMRGAEYRHVSTQAEAEEERRRLWAQ